MGSRKNRGIIGLVGTEHKDWRRTLVFLWMAQVFSIIGFGFALPFAPYYVQELGITDPSKVRIWYGLFLSITGLPLAIATPFWGILSDKVGRKPMSLRASIAGALILGSMGFARSANSLLILRVFQGFFTGTVTANLTLIVTQSPEDRIGLSIGVMNSAVFAGNTIGPLLGGLFADKFGYRYGYFISGISLFLSFCITLLFVNENFEKGKSDSSARALKDALKTMFNDRRIIKILSLIFVFAVATVLLRPLYPLLVQELLPSGEGLALYAGIVNSARGIATVLAGLIIGVIVDRYKNIPIGAVIASLAALTLVPLVFVDSILKLIVFVFIAAFLMGGINPVLNTYLSRFVPNKKRGAAYGIAGSSKALGWAAGGVSGGFLSAQYGLRNVFIFGAAFFAFIAMIFLTAERKTDRI